MPRPTRRSVIACVIALAAAASILCASPAMAAAELAAAADPQTVAPEDGALVESGAIELSWTAVPGADGYEVRWSIGATVDAGGVLPGGSSTTVVEPAYTLTAASGSTYTWQVRTLPDGAWSTFSTFSVDLELATLALPDQAGAAPAATTGQGVSTIPGSVWIGGALGFSAVFLVVVVIQSRVRREQDA